MALRATEDMLDHIDRTPGPQGKRGPGSAISAAAHHSNVPGPVPAGQRDQGNVSSRILTPLEAVVTTNLLVDRLQHRVRRHGADIEVGHLREGRRLPFPFLHPIRDVVPFVADQSLLQRADVDGRPWIDAHHAEAGVHPVVDDEIDRLLQVFLGFIFVGHHERRVDDQSGPPALVDAAADDIQHRGFS